jgi:hypothetical protein
MRNMKTQKPETLSVRAMHMDGTNPSFVTKSPTSTTPLMTQMYEKIASAVFHAKRGHLRFMGFRVFM